MKYIFLLLLCCSIFNSSFGQSDSSHTWMIDVSTSINSVAPNKEIRTRKKSVKAGFERAIFPPKLQVTATRLLSNNAGVSFRTSLKGLQNSVFSFRGDPTNYTYSSYQNIDSFHLRMNAIQVGVDYNKFRENGFHSSIGLSYVGVFSKVYSSLSEIYNEDFVASNAFSIVETTNLTPYVQYDQFVSVTGSLGSCFSIGNKFYIDIGVGSSFYFGKRKDKFDIDYDATTPIETKENYDYKMIMKPAVRRMALGNLLRQHYIEIYVKFGIKI